MNKEKIAAIIKNAAAIVVILALFVIIFYQNRDRALSGIFEKKPEQSQEKESEKTAFEGSLYGEAYPIGDDVCYITTTAYGILSADGKVRSSEIALSEPKLHCEDEYTVRYDKDAKEAVVSKRERQYYTIKTENRLISAKVNRNGYTVAATEKEGYNSEILVYNRAGEPIFKWDISKSEFLDADINCDNNMLALSLSGVKDKQMSGEIVFIDITDAKIKTQKSYPRELFYKVDFNRNGTSVAVGSDALVYFNADGGVKWRYKYGGRTLIKADVSQPNSMVLAFSAKGSGIKGNSTEIEVINRLGKRAAKITASGISDDISTSTAGIAVAFGKTAHIYDFNLSEEQQLQSETGIKKLVFFRDGKHLLVIGNSGGKILSR